MNVRSRAVRSPAAGGLAAAGARPALRVTWSLTAPGGGGTIECLITLGAGGAADLELRATGGLVPETAVPARITRAGALVHIDAPGILALTLRVRGQRATLVYARLVATETARGVTDVPQVIGDVEIARLLAASSHPSGHRGIRGLPERRVPA